MNLWWRRKEHWSRSLVKTRRHTGSITNLNSKNLLARKAMIMQNRSNPTNFRPVSIFSLIAKFLTVFLSCPQGTRLARDICSGKAAWIRFWNLIRWVRSREGIQINKITSVLLRKMLMLLTLFSRRVIWIYQNCLLTANFLADSTPTISTLIFDFLICFSLISESVLTMNKGSLILCLLKID